MRVLLVEDDPLLSDAMSRALTQAAHVVDVARTGPDADTGLQSTEYGLVVLDVGLPGFDGLEVLRRMRARGLSIPVLIVTVRDAIDDLVLGLDVGADDYITKPFHLYEFEARVRALIRRGHVSSSSSIVNGRVRLDLAGRRLFADDQPLDLTAREFALIELLILRAGRVVTRQQIIDNLYGWEDNSSSNTIEVFIHRLRRKLAETGLDIQTVRGMGYLVDNAR
jgi:two-component system, OmpR family, response regulator